MSQTQELVFNTLLEGYNDHLKYYRYLLMPTLPNLEYRGSI